MKNINSKTTDNTLAEYQPVEDSVVIYHSDDDIVRLEVQLLDETVWLTQAQMAELFQKDISVISRHIRNIFTEGELEEDSNLHFLQIPFSDKPVKLYNLDVIISVGYRVKSKRGTQFRRWANTIIKEYLLRGYTINQHLTLMEQRIDRQLQEHSEQIHGLEKKVDFFVRTSLPPKEGIFFDGQIFDAYTFVSDLIRTAQKRLILFDNYVDDSVLKLIDKRNAGVDAKIYTKSISPQLSLDLQRHNAQYPPIDIIVFQNAHDRFLCIDNTVYHIGASLKDLGKKWFAFSKMVVSTDMLISKI